MLSYENVVDAGSGSDEEDRLLGSEGEGSPAGVPSLEASPRVAHALLSCRGDEENESQDGAGAHVWHHGDLNGSGKSECWECHTENIYFFFFINLAVFILPVQSSFIY